MSLGINTRLALNDVAEAADDPGDDALAYLLDRLEALDRLRHLLVKETTWAVTECRREGASWAQVADALRISRQAAQQRYGERGQEDQASGTEPFWPLMGPPAP